MEFFDKFKAGELTLELVQASKLGDKFGESLGGSQASAEVPQKFPRLPQRFPRLPRKFPGLLRKFSDFPRGQPLSLGSLTPSPDSHKNFL